MKIGFILASIFITFFSAGQTDNIGAGRAIHLQASGDYVDLGNIYDNLNLPLTVSAWVYLDPSTSGPAPIFASQENADLYNGFQIFVWAGGVIFEYGDGQGTNSPAFRKGKIASFSTNSLLGRWIHVCGVMTSVFDIQLYINGIDVGGNFSGTSELPMDSNFPADVAKIGTYFSNGTTYSLRGSIDEVRLWDRGLTATEVRDGMCKKLQGNEPGLIGYWNFDETSGDVILDKSPNQYNGQLRGNTTREYSGAPLGDFAKAFYPSVKDNIEFRDIEEMLVKVQEVVEGVQIYSVRAPLPSQTTGLDLAMVKSAYYGVFLSSLSTGFTFDTDFPNHCEVYTRHDNSVSAWNKKRLPSTMVQDRIEYFLYQSSVVFKTTPNAITPNNGDDVNQFFVVHQFPGASIELVIVNRWGKEVFRSDNYQNDWDGGDLSPGVYFVKISAECASFKGALTIIR